MKTWQEIDGLTPDADIEAYQSLAEKVPDGSMIVEVGCFHGKSLASLAEIIQRKKLRPVAVDLWDDGAQRFGATLAPFFKDMLVQFKANMREVGLSPAVICGTSEEAANLFHDLISLPADMPSLVYLDDDHSYDSVKAGIGAWWGLLNHGGILGGHDYGNENIGVKQAVDEFTNGERLVLNRNDGWVWWVVKP